MNQRSQVILLAAGRGTRLGEQTADLPKTLIRVGGKPLCGHILESLEPFHPGKLVVVGGFEFDKLASAVSSQNSSARLVFNSDSHKGNLITLLCAEKELSGPFLIMNADHLYSRSILERIFSSVEAAKITIACDFDRPLLEDDMKVKLNDDKSLIIMDKKLSIYQGGYVGVTLIPEGKRLIYWQAARRVLEKRGEMVCVEEVLNELAAEGEKIGVLDVSGSCWLEVDTPSDLKRAEELIGRVKTL